MKAVGGALVVMLGLAAACSGDEQFCTAALAIPAVEVDVSALETASVVCVGDGCAPVEGGTAAMGEPEIEADTTAVDLVVLDREGATVATAEALRLPRLYANGFDCGGDAPSGTVTFDASGDVTVSADTDAGTDG